MAMAKDITDIKVGLGKIEQRLENIETAMKKCPEPEKHNEINRFMASTRMATKIGIVVLSTLAVVIIGVLAKTYLNGGG